MYSLYIVWSKYRQALEKLETMIVDQIGPPKENVGLRGVKQQTFNSYLAKMREIYDPRIF